MGRTDEDVIAFSGYGETEAVQQRRLGRLETGALFQSLPAGGAPARKQQEQNQGEKMGHDSTNVHGRSVTGIQGSSSCSACREGKSMT